MAAPESCTRYPLRIGLICRVFLKILENFVTHVAISSALDCIATTDGLKPNCSLCPRAVPINPHLLRIDQPREHSNARQPHGRRALLSSPTGCWFRLRPELPITSPDGASVEARGPVSSDTGNKSSCPGAYPTHPSLRNKPVNRCNPPGSRGTLSRPMDDRSGGPVEGVDLARDVRLGPVQPRAQP
jgi:hypothetical protein